MNRKEITASLKRQVTEKTEGFKSLRIARTVYPTGLPQYSKVGGKYQWYGISEQRTLN